MDTQKGGRAAAVVVALLLGSSMARAETEAAQPEPEPESESATVDVSPGATPVDPAMDARWRTRLYGFVELDGIHDTTQSFGPASNNAVLARPGTYAATHGRTQLVANNSLLGLRVEPPAFGRIKTSAQVELDFFGVQPSDSTEQTTFTGAAVRMRLFYLKIETPIVDILAGQYHDLFAWGGEGFFQNSLAFLGVAGEIYHRNPQLRLSKGFAGSAASLDIAVAAVRPVQRDSETPDLQAGIKLALLKWKGASAQGFGQPGVLPLTIGVSGVGRRFAVAEFLTNPGTAKTAYGWGLAANAFLPVIPAWSSKNRGNALSLVGEVSMGTGISDLYTGLTGGALFPLLPDPSGGISPPPIYRPNIDSGIVTYDANANLKTIDWRAFVVGVQYYLPIDGGRFWVAATYSQLKSPNILELTPPASRGGIFIQQDYADGSLFFAITPAAQMGLSFQGTQQTFGDLPFAVGGNTAHPVSRNYRSELGFRLFF